MNSGKRSVFPLKKIRVLWEGNNRCHPSRRGRNLMVGPRGKGHSNEEKEKGHPEVKPAKWKGGEFPELGEKEVGWGKGDIQQKE